VLTVTLSHSATPAAGFDVSVVIPVCNEQDNVLPLAREVHAALEGRYRYETIFVDDGSTDGTAEAVRAARRDGMPGIRLIRHSVRSGQSAAVATGVREARAPWIATLDGDGQNDPADIRNLLEAARTATSRGCGWSWAIAPRAATRGCGGSRRAWRTACAAGC